MNPRHLLVLDDEIDLGSTIASVATSAGMTATATTTPQAFFDALDEREPDLIALDLVMPTMDGLEVMECLAERRCRAGIMIVSGLGSKILDAARHLAMEHGLTLVGVLHKPFSVADLRRLLDVVDDPAPKVARMPEAATHDSGGCVEALRQALASGRILPHYQPKVACSDMRVLGFEALARWDDPELGLIAPDRFVALAEGNGLIDNLTWVMLDHAVDWLARHFRDTRLCMAVNLSARSSIGSPTFPDRLAGLCESHGIAPERLALELTESHAMVDARASLSQLTRLRMKGFKLAIDDFGTGFSTMQQLLRLPFSEIKIDRSFVGQALDDAASRKVIESLIELGHSLDMACTAEGVEDAPTLEYLDGLGCEFAQGYHIARPMPGHQAVAWVAGRSQVD